MIKYLDKNDEYKSIIDKGIWIIDFYATWCGPCKSMDEVLVNASFVDILKINVDDFLNIAKEYGVMSIPTLCYFKDGKMIDRKIGLQSLEEIKSIVEKMK